MADTTTLRPPPLYKHTHTHTHSLFWQHTTTYTIIIHNRGQLQAHRNSGRQFADSRRVDRFGEQQTSSCCSPHLFDDDVYGATLIQIQILILVLVLILGLVRCLVLSLLVCVHWFSRNPRSIVARETEQRKQSDMQMGQMPAKDRPARDRPARDGHTNKMLGSVLEAGR